MTKQYHPLIKQLLDGELSPAALPPELRAEGDEALHVLAAVDRAPVVLSAELEQRVMGQVLRHARSPIRRAWRWLVGVRDVDVRGRVRPWGLGLAAAQAGGGGALGEPWDWVRCSPSRWPVGFRRRGTWGAGSRAGCHPRSSPPCDSSPRTRPRAGCRSSRWSIRRPRAAPRECRPSA